jgi:hypothetical protein
VSEYADAIEAVISPYQQAGQELAVDKSPDEAARAFELSAVSGAPADQIAPNIDEFEAQHKQFLGQQLLNKNPSLTSFVNAHPLHGQLINDDLGNLDAFTKAMARLNGSHAARAGFQGFREGFGEDFGGPTAQFIEEKMPQAGHLARAAALAIGIPVETVSRALAGGVGFAKQFTNQYAKDMGLSEQAAEKFSNDLAGMLEYELQKPSVGVKPGVGREDLRWNPDLGKFAPAEGEVLPPEPKPVAPGGLRSPGETIEVPREPAPATPPPGEVRPQLQLDMGAVSRSDPYQ